MTSYAEACKQLLTPAMKELAAGIVCSVRDNGPAATARLIAEMPADQRITLTVVLAALVPDDQALEIGALRPYTPDAPADPVTEIQDVIEARLVLEGIPSRPTSRHRLPVDPEQARENLRAANREIDEFDRVTGRRPAARSAA
ncbi:hypothetical protein [Nonomuraea glycinis]|uniref:hypothetical protein n=1 Tax=Nonomuraea glycinis TaxID=2047744 RepID=UPI0033A127E2